MFVKVPSVTWLQFKTVVLMRRSKKSVLLSLATSARQLILKLTDWHWKNLTIHSCKNKSWPRDLTSLHTHTHVQVHLNLLDLITISWPHTVHRYRCSLIHSSEMFPLSLSRTFLLNLILEQYALCSSFDLNNLTTRQLVKFSLTSFTCKFFNDLKINLDGKSFSTPCFYPCLYFSLKIIATGLNYA